MDRIFQFLFFLALAFLLFLAGAAAMFFRAGPAPLLSRAFEGGKALYEYAAFAGAHEKFNSHLWVAAVRPEKGATIHDPVQAFEGYTLYTSTHAHEARLMDMEGKVVHRWALPHDRLAAVSLRKVKKTAGHYVYWRKLHLYPNGDLLVAYSTARLTPWGYGLVKLDRESNILWAYDDYVHHDLDVAPDGRIVAPVHWIAEAAPDGLGHLTPPVVEDGLVILSPDGKELKRLSLTQAFKNSAYAAWLDRIVDRDKGDITHNNNSEWLPDGTILISLRETGVIAKLDPVSEKIVWASAGPWLAQHDPDFLPNGHILLFDNKGAQNPEGHSRLLEIDPVTQAVVWSYGGFDNDIRGAQQPLENGNILVTDSQNGRIFEVTRGKKIVWEYVSPVREGPDGKFMPVICSALRYTKKDLTFLGD